MANRRLTAPARLAVAAAAMAVLAACATSDAETAVGPAVTTVPSTTTTTTTPPPPAAPAAAPAPAHRPAPVSVLPGTEARPARAARPAPAPAPARRGPTQLGRIQIGRIGLDHAIYEGHSLEVLKYGPGHWTGTAMPGDVGNTVFPGHRTTHSRPFWDIDLIQKGDTVVFVTDAGRFVYQVTDAFVVDDSETWIANSTSTPTFTIFACHPKGSARQRYVVKGSLAKAERKPGAPSPSGGAGGSGGSGGSPPPPPPTTTTTAPTCTICLP